MNDSFYGVWTLHCQDCGRDLAGPDDDRPSAAADHLRDNPEHSIVGVYRGPSPHAQNGA